MDKKIFLFDKEFYDKEPINALTEKECEELVADSKYVGDDSILKIDANGYESVIDALDEEVGFIDAAYFYIRAFGF